ncbi:MAG: hypothetical protein KF779_07785 [Hyphomonadaceae bacterium]|nr:hypothetical protein [Hyphomonadaceae bacterium]MCA8886805.1 hypothetical protein [Hyphomonadaceae bacterium]
MARRPSFFALVAIACAVNWAPTMDAHAAAQGPIGACAQTSVIDYGFRADASGSAIEYANGQVQIDYDFIEGIHHSRRGDVVRLCLTEIPIGCPPGDDRGRTYKATNLRTRESWSALDSEHSCGGA